MTCNRSLLGAAVFALLPLSAVQAQSQADQGPLLHPADGGSVVDTFYGVFRTHCGLPALHPLRAPEVERAPPDTTSGTVEEITVTYYVTEPDEVCPAVPPIEQRFPVEIGRLLKGTTAVIQTYVTLDDDGNPLATPAESTYLAWANVGDTPSLAVSGTWFDPGAAGTGVSLSLADTGGSEPTAVLFLATLDDAGTPLWLTGAGAFEDAVLTVPLTRSTTTPDGIGTEPAGTATFAYLGCGEARLTVDGVDVRFPDSTGADLQQLTTTAGLDTCEPKGTPLLGD